MVYIILQICRLRMLLVIITFHPLSIITHIYIHKQNHSNVSAMLRSYHEMRFSPLAFNWKNAYVHASKMRMEVPKWQSCLRSYIKRNSISLIAINGLEWNLISKISSTVYLFENYKSGKNLLRYSSTTTKYALF